MKIVAHLLEQSGCIKDGYRGALEMYEANDHINQDAERSPIFLNLRWTTEKRGLRCFGEIQHRYTIAPAQYLRALHLRSENSFSDVHCLYLAIVPRFPQWTKLCKYDTAFPLKQNI